MPDHIHILIGMKPVDSLSDSVKEIKEIKEIKRDSSKWINN